MKQFFWNIVYKNITAEIHHRCTMTIVTLNDNYIIWCTSNMQYVVYNLWKYLYKVSTVYSLNILWNH